MALLFEKNWEGIVNKKVKNSGSATAKLSCLLFGGVSVFALCLAMPAMAQDSQTLETVVVTGQRASIEKAIQIKENADQIVDSIVADDAGKLPDRSITEVLQRVSGVTITHFNNPGSPDDYTVEGSAPTVRGLPGGTSLLNGHNAFSANGGRNILWSDVPSELMKAVDVFKTYTPDQVEGGLGGTINLRTHLPFDFDGTKIAGRVGLSYGDLIKQARPVASAMVSTRFNTKWGEMGLLVDLSYDDSSYRNDEIGVSPYFPHTDVLDNYTLGPVDPSTHQPTVNKTGSTTYFLPSGFGYHTSFGYHQRGGGTVAFQWHPTDTLSIFAQAFSSVNETDKTSYGYSANAGGERANFTQTSGDILGALTGPAPTPTDPLYHVWDSKNYLLKSNTYLNPTVMNNCIQPNQQCSLADTTTTADHQFTRTTDINVGVNWEPNDNWLVRTAFDFIYAKANYTNNQVGGEAYMPAFGVDMSGTYPTFVFQDPSQLRTSSNYFWYNTMKDLQKNYGQEMQGNIDVEYHLNRGIFKDLKFGWRGDVRTERDQDTGYNWQGLSPPWTTPQYYWSAANATKDTILYKFPNYFRGEVNLPGQALFVDGAKVGMLDDAYFQNQYNCSHNGDVAHCPTQTPYTTKAFLPYDAKHYKTVNMAGYAMVTFAKDDLFGMAMSGNAGARLVYVDNQANGWFSAYGSSQFHFTADGPLYSTAAVGTILSRDSQGNVTSTVPGQAVAGGRVSWTVLPAFNVQLMPTDKVHIRLAGSITAEQPTFAGIYGSYFVATQNVANPNRPSAQHCTTTPTDPLCSLPASVAVLTGFDYQGDNPGLKPQLGRNLDMSFEWYGDGGAEAYLSLFYKSIKHKTTTVLSIENRPWLLGQPDLNTPDNGSCVQVNYQCTFTQNGVATYVMPTVVQGKQNSNKEAIVRGFEVGFNKYFDWSFVPHYLKGFGFSGNYTYIDSKAPGSYSLDMFGNNIASHLPMEGLSHHAINAQLMYDRDPISFRLAYNWRSKYLMLASGYNSGGNYLGSNSGTTCVQNNSAAGGWGGNLQPGYCYYALPVWSKSFGQLDAGLDYAIDDNWRLSIQSQNLLNTKAKTTMGINLPAYTDATGISRPAQEEVSRGWFVADRRVSIDLRFNY